MINRQCETRLVGQLLQFPFPQALAPAVAPTAVGSDQFCSVNLARISVKALKTPLPTNSRANANATETLNIHGVMANGSKNLVLINDQVYQDGDEVDGIKIVKINLDHITVINNGEEEQISVKN
jgi:type II secretory pathway component PulC